MAIFDLPAKWLFVTRNISNWKLSLFVIQHGPVSTCLNAGYLRETAIDAVTIGLHTYILATIYQSHICAHNKYILQNLNFYSSGVGGRRLVLQPFSMQYIEWHGLYACRQVRQGPQSAWSHYFVCNTVQIFMFFPNKQNLTRHFRLLLVMNLISIWITAATLEQHNL